MVFFQKIWMVVLNVIAIRVGKVRRRTQNTLLYICCCFLACTYIIWYACAFFSIEISKISEAVTGGVVFLLILFMSLKGKLHVVRWRKSLTFVFFSCPILMLISQLSHPIGEGIPEMAIAMLVFFPGLYLCWTNREDYENLFKWISRGVSQVLMVYLFICLVIFPVTTSIEAGVRYAAMTPNPNFLGMLGVAGVTCSLYLIEQEPFYRAWIYIISLGLSIFSIISSASRTALLVILLQIIAFLFYFIRHKILKQQNKIASILVLLTTSIVILFSACVLPYIVNYRAVVISYAGATIDIKEKVLIAEEPQEEDTANNTQGVLPFNRLEGSPGQDLNQRSSGRIVVWKNYLRHLNLIGHDGSELLYIEDGYEKKEWAHNTAIEIAYRCGIIPGILFLVLEIGAGIVMLRWLLSKYYKSWKLFSILCIIAFCIYSVLEVVIFPFEHIIMFLFFVAITPMFKKASSSDKGNR